MQPIQSSMSIDTLSPIASPPKRRRVSSSASGTSLSPRGNAAAKPKHVLSPYYSETTRFEIGVDEAGRGPMFGRLYVAGVVLPKGEIFRHDMMKDSKKFSSATKIREAAAYIKEHALAWHIAFVEPAVIDEINIRQAVLRAMRECVKSNLEQISRHYVDVCPHEDFMLLIDGNDFTPYMVFTEETQEMEEVQHTTVEGGDNTYTSIAAASILAKVARDDYVEDLCAKYPVLDERYGLAKNKGYGTKTHLTGIRAHGITQWHRRSFGLCGSAEMSAIPEEG